MNLRNRYVRFKIADIYLPDPLIVLNELHGEDLLEGRVVDVSDSGVQPATFAVVEVKELDQMIIVPVERITDIS